MQFRKISDTKIQCVISLEEMSEKGIKIDDFLDHREKTEEFIREVLAEAKYELDLQDMGCFYSVQMSVMPEGDVSLVITGEHAENVGGALAEFGKRLQDFKEVMEEAKKKLDQKKEEVSDNEAENEAQSSNQEVVDVPIWARVNTLEQCIAISKQLVSKSEPESAVYKYDDTYYMQFHFLQKEHQVAGTILVVLEYAQEIFTQDQGGDLLLEHGTPICAEHAIETLASL